MKNPLTPEILDRLIATKTDEEYAALLIELNVEIPPSSAVERGGAEREPIPLHELPGMEDEA